MKDRISISYNKESEPNLRDQIKILQNREGIYKGRSIADICGMILNKYIQKEIKKLNKNSN